LGDKKDRSYRFCGSKALLKLLQNSNKYNQAGKPS
jgi:hypothetical protein